MQEIEKMCLEMDVIAKKYGFSFIGEITLFALNEKQIGPDSELTKTEYIRHYFKK